jgi:protein phosphatase
MTHPGKVRASNEDACLAAPDRGIWAVADGMGGHAAGELASQMITDALAETPICGSLGALIGEVYQRLQEVNERLHEEAAKRREHVIGSTVVVLLAHGRYAVVMWAGDSRAYRYRNGRLQQLTRDHSQVEELIAQGLLDRAEAEGHPAANVITRAVGVMEHLELDSEMFEVLDGDTFLLCSDGLTKEVSEADIAGVLAIGEDCRICELLVECALSAGGRDNVAVVSATATDPASMMKTQRNPSLSALQSGGQRGQYRT